MNLQGLTDAARHYAGTYAGYPIKQLGRGVAYVGDKVATMGDANTSDFFADRGAEIVGAGRYMEEDPIRTVGIGAGGYLANQFLGNPVGGMTDAVTFGVTNFRPDADEVAPAPVQYSQAYGATGIPPLDAKQMAYEIRRLEKIGAVNNLTLNELRRMQAGGQAPPPGYA